MEGNRKLSAIGLMLALVAASQGGCAGTARTTQPPVRETAAAPAVNQGPQSVAGKVVETMDAGGYTYICLEKAGEKTWAAIPVTKVVVGEELELRPGMEMTNFTSKALSRTFEKIIFTDGAVTGTNARMPAGHPPVDAKAQTPLSPAAADAMASMKGHAMFGQPAAEGSTEGLAGKVTETMNAGGYTYISLEKDGKKAWVAVPLTQVSVGKEIEVQPGMVMTNFTSKTLKRTFESIIFSGGIVSGE